MIAGANDVQNMHMRNEMSDDEVQSSIDQQVDVKWAG